MSPRYLLPLALLAATLALACGDSADSESGGTAGQGGSAGSAGVGGSAGTAGQGGSAGTAGQGGAGGAACTPWTQGAGGASHADATVPKDGAACPVEGFELCTGPLFGQTASVLSKCEQGAWKTVEPTSACKPGYQECNLGSPAPQDNSCCTTAMLCGNLFCDGKRWWKP